MANLEQLNESVFEKNVIKSEIPVLVDFFAEWCGPCRMMGPVLEGVASKMVGKLKVYKLDTDQAQNIAAEYQITGIPCLIMFKDGKEVKRMVGYQAEDTILKQIEEII